MQEKHGGTCTGSRQAGCYVEKCPSTQVSCYEKCPCYVRCPTPPPTTPVTPPPTTPPPTTPRPTQPTYIYVNGKSFRIGQDVYDLHPWPNKISYGQRGTVAHQQTVPGKVRVEYASTTTARDVGWLSTTKPPLVVNDAYCTTSAGSGYWANMGTGPFFESLSACKARCYHNTSCLSVAYSVKEGRDWEIVTGRHDAGIGKCYICSTITTTSHSNWVFYIVKSYWDPK